jgi:hypothetical protein
MQISCLVCNWDSSFLFYSNKDWFINSFNSVSFVDVLHFCALFWKSIYAALQTKFKGIVHCRQRFCPVFNCDIIYFGLVWQRKFKIYQFGSILYFPEIVLFTYKFLWFVSFDLKLKQISTIFFHKLWIRIWLLIFDFDKLVIVSSFSEPV